MGGSGAQSDTGSEAPTDSGDEYSDEEQQGALSSDDGKGAASGSRRR